MATIHFLNVKQGDCSVISHNSDRVTVIDVCNAKPPDVQAEKSIAEMAQLERGISGNFQQKKHPVNPISYLRGAQYWQHFPVYPDTSRHGSHGWD